MKERKTHRQEIIQKGSYFHAKNPYKSGRTLKSHV